MTEAPAGEAATVTVTAYDRIGLHDLRSRPDGPDGQDVILGRLATGDFVTVPAVALRVLDHLRAGRTVAETHDLVHRETGEELDVEDFVTGLAALGFVSDISGVPLAGPPPRRPTLPWITPRRAAWSLSPALAWAFGALVAAALAVLTAHPGLMPGYRSLVWSHYGSLVLLTTFGLGWSLVFLHELAHLVTARATGVPARIEMGTRLQVLVAQTDMSGIELAPRRHRLTAYLAGIAVNLGAAAAGILGLAAAGPGAPVRRPLEILVLIALVALPFQAMVFMRTDVYFVLQDLTGCADLFGDGRAYARHLARRLLPGRRGADRADDPSRALPAAQRRAVRIYSGVLVLGTTLFLTSLAAVTVPADVTLLTRGARHLAGPGHSVQQRLDGTAVLLVIGGAQLLWARTKWREGRRRRRDRRAG